MNLDNYEVKVDAGNTDIRYKLEKETENQVEYLKVKLNDIATDAFDVYKLQDLDNITFNEQNNEYIVRVLVVEYPGGGPILEIGEANIHLIKKNDIITLKQVEFEKYDENVIKENTES